MIEINGVNKKFSNTDALNNLIAAVQEKSIFGLVGTNGAGKSTLLRIMCGVICPDTGSVMVDGENVYENPKVKGRICFLSDEAYFFPNATGESMAEYYEILYPHFDEYRFFDLMERFQLDRRRKLASFSKGMSVRCSCSLESVPDQISSLRRDLRRPGSADASSHESILAGELSKRDFSVVIASHSLRELEDICDHIGLLHKGGILLSRDLEDMKYHIHKLQCVIRDPEKEKELLEELNVVQYEKRGSLLTVIARGTRQEILRV